MAFYKFLSGLNWKKFLLSNGIILLLILLMTSYVRIRLLSTPLDRDEAEYAYAGQLILHGTPPYSEIYNMKYPGTYVVYSLVMAVFGQSDTGIHLGLLFINLITCMLIFLVGKRLFSIHAAAISASVFALLSVGEQLQGCSANTEHFVILFAMAGILKLLDFINSESYLKLFFSGMFFGLAFLMKQHGFAFAFFGAVYLVYHSVFVKKQKSLTILKQCGMLASGALAVILLTLAILYICGVFGKFWFLTYSYAKEYVSYVDLNVGWNNLVYGIKAITGNSVLLWSLAVAGLLAIPWFSETRKHIFFLLVFIICSFIAICPGFYFRPHYFILTLPVVAILAGALFYFLYRLSKALKFNRVVENILPVLFILVAVFYFYTHHRFLFSLKPEQVSRAMFHANPFPESVEIAKYIQANSNATDKVAVIGSEPQIFFYSKRKSATGYIYIYPLIECNKYAQTMLDEFIMEIEKAAPKFLVYTSHSGTWIGNEARKNKIFSWYDSYKNKYYEKAGIVEIVNDSLTTYHWGENSLKYKVSGDEWLEIYKRKQR